MHFALRMLGETWIVRDHADGRALAVQVLQEFHHGLAVARIQISSRFVGKKNGWLPTERAGHGNALLLAS